MDAISFSRGVFPTQGSNPGLLHCKKMLYYLRHQKREAKWCNYFLKKYFLFLILRSLNSESIMNPAQFRIWTFRRHNPLSILFPDCLAHPAVWYPSYHPIPLQGFFFSVDLMPVPVSLLELCSTRLDWHSFRHTKTDFDCICPFRSEAACWACSASRSGLGP